MTEIRINDKISFIPASDNPLSADVGIVRENGEIWLFDVGSGENGVTEWNGSIHVVLSHFHQDHTGNINRVNASEIFGSKETIAHIQQGTVVQNNIKIGNLHIFPLPSSHTKGCLGLEIDETYAFIGDGLYSRFKDGCYVYNAQIVQEEIAVLKKLKAPFLLVSHFDGMVRPKEEAIAELEAIYRARNKNEVEIRIKAE